MTQPNGRILALDYGKRRIGLAISDPLGITAQSLPTFTRGRIREDFARLKSLIAEKEVRLLVFGDPKYMSGDESPLSAEMKEFALHLQQETNLPVVYCDERLTSSQAHRLLSEEGMKREDRKGKVDRIAAVLILQSYLSSLEHSGAEPE
ncbi:MAG: Holliday junction resolvase RuvX [Bryobacter sp.]|nr:Holliday junction resolvase RuvX [Bryobacter sp.]